MAAQVPSDLLARLEGRLDRVVVLRALMLGDLLCAVPALRALRAGLPAAQITLVGLPWAAELAQRLDCVDHFIALPGYPGLPETPADVRALPRFLETVQRERYDLALQLHGSGAIVNSLLATLGARYHAGFHDGACWYPREREEEAALWRRWPQEGHEVMRLLALTDHLGLPRRGTALEFPVRPADRAQLTRLWPQVDAAEPYVCVHPGAQLPSRRWLPERFAQVADSLAKQGYRIVLTGSAAEAALVRRVEECMHARPINLAGRTSLWTLGALLERAVHLISNDTGISHIAAALGTPSVIVSCGADVTRWAPLDTARHRVLAHTVPCRPCSARVCPTGHECAVGVSAERVLAAVPPPAVLPAVSHG